MSEAKKEVKLPLKVMINKEKSKVLFAEADNHFADILLSFLTLPLGRVMKVLEKHYGDKAPKIASLSNLYHSLNFFGNAHFVTEPEGAKNTLLTPTNSFEDEYDMLKLDITDSSPADCSYCPINNVSISKNCDQSKCCRSCRAHAKRSTQAASSDGVFTLHETFFIICDDLRIFPNDRGLFGVITFLGITDMDIDEAKLVAVDFGLSEIMNLLKASLTSSTPLSDVILKKTNSESQPMTPLPQIAGEESPRYGNLSLKVMIQRSTGKFLSAQAKADFIEFLFGLFSITLGGAERHLGGRTCFKAINNLNRSTSDLIDDKYFKSPVMKERLMKPNEGLWKRNYLSGSRTYEVTDDLNVKPFCIVPVISSLKKQKIPISDVEELELQIKAKEALRILKASLTSTSVLTSALLTQIISNKRLKREKSGYSV